MLGPMITIGGRGCEQDLKNVSWLNKEQFASSLSLLFILLFRYTALSTKLSLIELNQHNMISSPWSSSFYQYIR